jgi:hypothetical protein
MNFHGTLSASESDQQDGFFGQVEVVICAAEKYAVVGDDNRNTRDAA